MAKKSGNPVLSAPIGPNEVIIDSKNYKRFLTPIVDGEPRKMGLYPPHPAKSALREEVAGSFDIPLIPESEWPDRLAEQIKNKAQLSDIRNQGKFGGQIPSRDQDGEPYCWGHSSTSAAMIARAVSNQPYADLSAFAICCMIKNYRSEGGWSEESLKYIANKGIPTSKTWPQQSKSRSNDKPETWAEAALYKFTPEWMNLTSGNKALIKQQMVTCLLLNIPCTTDYNWWSHAIIALDLVSISPFRIRIWNSWGDSWSQQGTGILEASKAIPDDSQAPRVITVAA